MKNSIKALLAGVLLITFIFCAVTGVNAQQACTGKKVLRLKMEQNNNGKMVAIDTTMNVDEHFDVKAFLVSKGFNGDDFPSAPCPAGRKMIISNDSHIVSDSVITEDIRPFETPLDSTFDMDIEKDVLIWTGDGKMEPLGENVYEYKQVGPDGKKVIIKRIKIVFSDLDEAEMKKLAPGMNDVQLEVKDLSLFPNPGNGRFTLKFSLPDTKTTTVRIMDLSGKKVYEEIIPGFTGQYEKQIDISKNGIGTYIIELLQGNKSSIKKVIIQ